MKKYQVNTPVKFFSGEIELAEKQAAKRSHCLAPVKGKKGVFEILSMVQFKAGEVVGLNNASKSCLNHMTEIADKPADKKK